MPEKMSLETNQTFKNRAKSQRISKLVDKSYKQPITQDYVEILKQFLLNFLSEQSDSFPKEFLIKLSQRFEDQFQSEIEDIIDEKAKYQRQNLLKYENLLQTNKMCLVYLIQRVKYLQKNCQTESQRLQSNNYEILEQSIQKAQKQIRKHIGIQYQMKICLQQQDDQIAQLNRKNLLLKEAKSTLAEEVLLLKRKNVELQEKYITAEQSRQKILKDIHLSEIKKKKNLKFHTQPEAEFLHGSKTRQQTGESTQLMKKHRSTISRSGGCSKMLSKQVSNIKLLENSFDVNLHNFITINHNIPTINLKQKPTQSRLQKQHFLKRRLTRQHQSICNSVNISQGQMKKLKEKQLKETYSLNKNIKYDNDEKRKYPGGNTYELKRKIERTKSVAY